VLCACVWALASSPQLVPMSSPHLGRPRRLRILNEARLPRQVDLHLCPLATVGHAQSSQARHCGGAQLPAQAPSDTRDPRVQADSVDILNRHLRFSAHAEAIGQCACRGDWTVRMPDICASVRMPRSIVPRDLLIRTLCHYFLLTGDWTKVNAQVRCARKGSDRREGRCADGWNFGRATF